MTVAMMVPQIWLARLENAWRREAVWLPLVSDRSQFLAAGGDRAYLGGLASDVTVRDYTRGTPITREDPAFNRTTLLLDKDKYWAVDVDDVDQVQAAPDLIDEYMTNAARGMALQVNDDIRAAFDSGLPTGRETTIAYADTAAGRGALVGAFRTVAGLADAGNWPTAGRYAVIGTHTQTEINTYFGDDEFEAGTGIVADQIIRDWRMGRLYGWDIVVDPGIPTAGAKTGRAGYFGVLGESVAYADNLRMVEALRPAEQFEDLVRGRMHYGAVRIRDDRCLKVIRTGL